MRLGWARDGAGAPRIGRGPSAAPGGSPPPAPAHRGTPRRRPHRGRDRSRRPQGGSCASRPACRNAGCAAEHRAGAVGRSRGGGPCPGAGRPRPAPSSLGFHGLQCSDQPCRAAACRCRRRRPVRPPEQLRALPSWRIMAIRAAAAGALNRAVRACSAGLRRAQLSHLGNGAAADPGRDRLAGTGSRRCRSRRTRPPAGLATRADHRALPDIQQVKGGFRRSLRPVEN